MSRFPGNIIKLPNVTPTQSSASGVWSLKDQMVYQRNNLWPFQRDPYFNYTTLLLQGNVPNTTGPQAMNLPLAYNADASTNNFLVTPNGDVGPRPFSPYFGGNYSVFFDGSSSLTPSSGAFMNLGTNNYTIEFFVFLTSNVGNNHALAANATNGLVVVIGDSKTTLNKYGVGDVVSTGSGLATNTWHHVAIVRAGTGATDTAIYINGVRVVQGQDNNNWTVTSNVRVAGNTSNQYITGYVSNLRVVTSAIYSGAFINVPTLPFSTAQSGTTFLTCQNNRFLDNGTTGATFTTTGSPRITDNSPFVSTDFTTGAGYFDGTGDYLSVNSNSTEFAFGTGDFTIEMFVYFSSLSFQVLYDARPASTDGVYPNIYLIDNTSKNIRWRVSGSDVITSSAVDPGTWYHLAVCRSGTSTKMFLNGVQTGSTYTDNNSYLNGGTTRPFVGGSSYSAGTAGVNGYITSVRVVKGSALYTTTFTPPTAPLTPVTNTQLLTLQTRAPSQNINFIDSSPNEFIVTKNGNTTQGTFSPFSPTGWSNYFGGSAFAQIANNAAFGSLNGVDYTIEFWVYQTTISGDQAILGCTSIGVSGFAIWTLSGQLHAFFGGGSTITGATLTANQWNHIALVRTSTNTQLYLNGASQGTPSTSAFVNNTSQPLMIGGITTGTGWNSDRYTTGYISAVRIIKGQALSTGNFTPPTALASSTVVGWTGANVPTQSITGTVGILTCQYNRFFDQTGKTITTSGSPSVQAFSPFAPANAVSPLVTGGSGYFDGTSDYLSVPANTAWNIFNRTNATVEFWFNPNAYSTDLDPIGYFQDNSNLWFVQFAGGQTNKPIKFYTVASGTSVSLDVNQSATTFNPAQWNHCAFVKSGSTWSIYINGARVASNGSAPSFSISGTLYLGARNTTVNLVTGYMSGIRITDTAVYTDTVYTVPTTPPTAIPNTSLLLNFTNGAAVDATGKNNLESVGNAQISTSVVKYGTGSLYFDGTGDYLVAPSRPTTSLEGDFTIEGWVYRAVSGNNYFFTIGDSLQSTGIECYIGSSGTALNVYSGGASRISSATLPGVTTWAHLAVVRSGSTVTLYLNGASGGTWTSSSTFSGAVYVGAEFYSGSISGSMNGYIDDLRITKGVARYTASFTPPTGPFPIG